MRTLSVPLVTDSWEPSTANPPGGADRTMNNRILVKLASAHALAAADPRSNLRPLYRTPIGGPAALGLGGAPQWYVADLPAEADQPWDLAHAHVAAQLG